MDTTTSTCNGPDSITTEELIAKIKDAMERLGPPLPEIRPSAFAAPGQVIKIPAEHSLSLYNKREIWFVSPVDYRKYIGDLDKCEY